MSKTHVTQEMALLIAKVGTTAPEVRKHPNGKEYLVHPERRHIRYRLFRLRDGSTEMAHDGGLKRWMELQFKPGMNWKNFTFDWDVSPSEPLKIVSIHEWVAEGGLLEQFHERTDQGTNVMQTRCTPTAFTKQS